MRYLNLTAVLVSKYGHEEDRVTGTTLEVRARIATWLETICFGDSIKFEDGSERPTTEKD